MKAIFDHSDIDIDDIDDDVRIDEIVIKVAMRRNNIQVFKLIMTVVKVLLS